MNEERRTAGAGIEIAHRATVGVDGLPACVELRETHEDHLLHSTVVRKARDINDGRAPGQSSFPTTDSALATRAPD
ncbi:hypothetical protein, partial [Rhodococcus wratislaviensis]|uniref:hypothetical protein n=1 Tax=Rhodococcus wratislaviensis TaxID=44752 RepID=UPI001C3F3479